MMAGVAEWVGWYGYIDYERRKAAMNATVTLPLPPNILNPRRHGHWNAIAAAKRKYVAAAVRTIEARRIPHFERADYRATFCVATLRDEDNLTAMLKYPLDALKAAGVIRDDSPRYLHLVEVPGQVALGRIVKRAGETAAEHLTRKYLRDARQGVTIEIWERSS